MLDREEVVAQPKLSNILGLILYFFVLTGPLKPEVEAEVAELQFWCSVVHLLPSPLGGHRRPPAIFWHARPPFCGRAS